MAQPRIVYVHGAGKQENRVVLKRRLDEHLFGSNQLDRTVLAYYSDLLHEEDPGSGEPEAAQVGPAAGPGAVAIRKAFERKADEVAIKESVKAAKRRARKTPGGAVAERITLPDPAFRFLAAIASRDVIDYLIGGRGPAIRERVAAAIPATGPLIVLAHSLGTIVAYDVLTGLVGRDVRVFLTVGCPLGIGNVQKRIGTKTMPPKIPSCAAAWLNFADPLDPVALEPILGGDYVPTPFIVDTLVDNRALFNHDLSGYLDTKQVKDAVQKALA